MQFSRQQHFILIIKEIKLKPLEEKQMYSRRISPGFSIKISGLSIDDM